MKATHFFAFVLLLFFFIHSSLELPLQDDLTSSETKSRLPETRQYSWLAKRQWEGDYNEYLEAKVQDFLDWLINSTRKGGMVRRHADGTYTSDVSAYLQDQAAKNFISWLKSGQPKQDASERRALVEPIRRRHVDGTFTSDYNKALDRLAAKEYIQRVMSPQAAGNSGKRS